MPTVAGPFPPTPASSLRSKPNPFDYEQPLAGPSRPRPTPIHQRSHELPPTPPQHDDPTASVRDGMYTPSSEYSEPRYRSEKIATSRRPHTTYPTTEDEHNYHHAHRKYTDPTPQTGGQYSTHEPSSPLPAQHQLDVDLDVYAQDYHELEDDMRQPTLSFVTTSTVDSTTSSPSITDAYTYGSDRMDAKVDPEPRLRMRTGRQNAYSSAESSMVSGAFSYHAYDNYPPPPMPTNTDLGLLRAEDEETTNSYQSPTSSYAHRQPWRSPVAQRHRATSISTSDGTDESSLGDQLSEGFAHSFSYLSGSFPVPRNAWDDEHRRHFAEPNAVAMVDDGRGSILDRERLEAMGGIEALCSLPDSDLNRLPRFTHLLLAGVGPDLMHILPTLLDVLSTTLVVLDISRNDFTSLPNVLRHCTSLEELNVSQNPLRAIPSFISDCTSLRMLVADSCMLQTLPSEMAQLPSLHTICVRGNRLVVLPSWLCLLAHLETLRIDNNPFAAQWVPIVAPILAMTLNGRHQRSSSQNSFRSINAGMTSLSTSQSSYAPSSSTDSLGLQHNRPLATPSQSLRSRPGTSLSVRAESPMPPAGRAPNRSASGPAPTSEMWMSSKDRLSAGGPPRRVQSAAYNNDGAEAEGQEKASKWGFLRKVSLSRMRTEKDRTAQLNASAAANLSSMPQISAPTLIGNMPRRPPLTSGWTTNMLPTRRPETPSELNMSTSSAPGTAAQSTINLPVIPQNAYPSVMGNRGKRRSFLPIDPTPPSLNVSIPSTSPFMAPQPTLADIPDHYETPDDAMETLGDVDAVSVRRAASTCHSESELSICDNDGRYARGLESIKSYLRDLYDLSLPPQEAYGGFEVIEGTEILSPEGTATQLRSSLADSTGSHRHVNADMTPLSRGVSLASSGGGERFSKASSDDTQEPTKRVKDDKTKRARVIREIYETEKTYVRGLEELVSIYVRAAALPSGNSKNESVIPVAERKVVFGGVESILLFHRDNFLPALEKVVKALIDGGDDDEGNVSAKAAHQVGEVFRTYIAYMKQYSTYINNFDNALSRMRSWLAPAGGSSNGASPAAKTNSSGIGAAAVGVGLMGSSVLPLGEVKATTTSPLTPSQRKRVKAFLKRCKESPKHSQINLESYLLLPVQRVPRYKLLLEDLALCTTPRESIGPNDALDDAIYEITTLASLMNEEKRDAESRLRLLHWQQRITSRGPSPLVQPHRKLILDGALTLIRVVKKASAFVEVDMSTSLSGDGDSTVTGTKSVVPVEFVKPEPMDKPIMLILCSDLLVLVQKRSGEGWDGQVDLFSVLRMATLREPATVSASNDRVLRVVDNRSIYYFNGGSHSTTLQWCRAINGQNRR